MRDPLVPFVIAPAEMTRRNVTALVEVAQVPGSKLIDFRTTRTVSAHLFELLEARWRPVAGLVPRLALVFPFHHYVMARPLAASTVVELAKRGTSLRLFYAAQRVEDWVRGRAVGEDVAGALLDLETSWNGALAPIVLDGAVHLIRTTGSIRRAAFLVRLAWIARRANEASRAAKIAREAVATIGDAIDPEASEVRRQALRALGDALADLGDTTAAKALFDEANARGNTLAEFVELAVASRARR
jgi:hypothetical protein